MTAPRPPRYIAFEWSAPELYGALVELKRAHGWQLLYCIGNDPPGRMKADFPDAIYQQTHDARYGVPAPALASVPRAVVDQPAAEDLAFATLTFLKQMDRAELLGGFSLHDRLLHFHRLYGYWSGVLDRLKPDLLLMPTSPHVGYDYVAYVIARRRRIPIVLFEYVTLAGMLAAIDGWEDGIPRIQKRYAEMRAHQPAGPVILSERMEEHLRALKGKYEGAMPYGLQVMLSTAAEIRKREEKKRETASGVGEKGLWARARAALSPGTPARDLPPFAPVDGYFRGTFHKRAPEDLSWQAVEHRRAHIESITRRYDELATEPDLGKPYVYVALHLQPERATNPNGRVYDEQHVIVALISSVLPAGWRIYVKEHPTHFLPHYATERGRWATFYERVLEIPGASLVSRHTPSFSLIDNARAVATVTGTSSWEALVRGVPSLVFGEAWYKGCDGAHFIRSRKDCRRALERIASGERPKEENVRLFLRAAEEVSFVGYISSDDAHIAGTDDATNSKRLAAAIMQCFEEQTGAKPADS